MTFNTKEYIDHLAEELIRNFDYAKNATTPVLKGTAREKEVIRKLELLLPNSIGIGSGCIIDTYGNISKQIDIVIYEKNFCPVFCINESFETTYYPCEGVIAAGEIKSELKSTELIDIFEKSKSVKRLKRLSIPETGKVVRGEYHSYRNYNSTISYECLPENGFDQKNKVFDQIFCFALCGKLKLKPETLTNKFGEIIKKTESGYENNLISILNDGLILFRNKEKNSIAYMKNDADSFYFLQRTSQNFQFLLKKINQVILGGRTVPIKHFDKYLNFEEGLIFIEGINGINKEI